MPSEANSYQVGGSHYQSDYIHWDWVIDVGLGYLDGNATKYFARAGKKGDEREDLEKGLHYLVKLKERLEARGTRPVLNFRCGWFLSDAVEKTRRFAEANAITWPMDRVLTIIAVWDNWADIQGAIDMVKEIINNLEVLPAQPVPLEDSNKHADRAGAVREDGW